MDHTIVAVDQLRAHLKSLRTAAGLTQAQAGDLLGVRQARIAQIESDPGSVSVDQLFRLLTMLGAKVVLRPPEPVKQGDAPSRASSPYRILGRQPGLKLPTPKPKSAVAANPMPASKPKAQLLSPTTIKVIKGQIGLPTVKATKVAEPMLGMKRKKPSTGSW